MLIGPENKRGVIKKGKLIFFSFFITTFSFLLLVTPSFAEEIVKTEQIILTWTQNPTNSQTITWLMPSNISAQVQYIEKARFRDSFDMANKINIEGIPFAGNDYYFTVNITDLKPNTTYLYRVGGEGFWSEILSFTTAADTEDFSFLYMGDVQEGYIEWADSLDYIYKNYPEIRFSLLGGDLTNNGNDAKEWGEFLNAATILSSQIPLMPTLGNHDGIMYRKFFVLPSNGPEGLKGDFYSFDYGNAHFVILDSNNNTNQKAKKWLQQDLQKTDKTWKFAVFHHPPYPTYNDGKGIDKSIRNNWIPILEEYGVDVVFVGHQHEYMRTHKIFQGEIQNDLNGEGIIYVMGNIGSKNYAFGSSYPYIAIEKTGSNYQIIDVKDKQLSFTAKTTKGEIIENFTINKSTEQLSLPYKANNDSDKYVKFNNKRIEQPNYFFLNNPFVHLGIETIVLPNFKNAVQIGIMAMKPNYYEDLRF